MVASIVDTCVLLDVVQHVLPRVGRQAAPHSHLRPLERLYPCVQDERVLPCELIGWEHAPAHVDVASMMTSRLDGPSCILY